MDSQNNINPHIFHIGLDQPAQYAIKIQGRLDCNILLDWFQGEVLSSNEVIGARDTGPAQVVTVLVGTVLDQAALHGLLARIRDLGLVLLYVDCLSAHSDGAKDELSGIMGGCNE